MTEPGPSRHIDFQDTEIAFSSKSDKELKDMNRLFTMMSKSFLVNVGSSLGLLAIRMRLPFVKEIVRKTMFGQFCGGENLLDCQETIDKLYREDTFTILDYGAEGKDSDAELDAVKEEILRSIDMAASNTSVPVVVAKCSGLSNSVLLEELQNGVSSLNETNKHLYEQFYVRMDEICEKAAEMGVAIYIDAEESWIQKGIDAIVYEMMEKYNREKAIVHNTYQLYRKGKYEQLVEDHKMAREKDYFLGAKLVRGAYMDKERRRAAEMGYPSPIHDTKQDTDNAFDSGVAYCVEHYKTISSCCASHNIDSNRLQVDLIGKKEVDIDHPHLNFSQLYGMSDFITFNLADAGYNVAKYVPYGAIEEVVPYLIRRAQENTSITGEVGRELRLVKKEMKRRGL